MSTKTITLEIDAYEKLRSSKGPGDSFSSVVRRAIIPERGLTGRELLAHLRERGSLLSPAELDALDGAHAAARGEPDDPWTEMRAASQ